MSRFQAFLWQNLALVALLVGSTAFAQEVPIESNSEPELVLEEGQPIRVKWSDGRQAILMEDLSYSFQLSVGMSMSHNTCAQVTPPRCYLKSPAQVRKLFYLWEVNPANPERVGEIVQKIPDEHDLRKIEEEPDNPFNVDLLYYLYTKPIFQIDRAVWAQLGLSDPAVNDVKDLIVCDNFNWLPLGDDSRTKDTVFIPAWLTQFEFPEVESYMQGTGFPQSVNQYTSALKSVEIKRNSPAEYEVNKIGAAGTLFTGFGGPILGYTTEFVFDIEQFQNHPGKFPANEPYQSPSCRVQFTLNFSELFTQFNAQGKEYNTLEFDPANVRPLLYDPNDPVIQLEYSEVEIRENAQ